MAMVHAPLQRARCETAIPPKTAGNPPKGRKERKAKLLPGPEHGDNKSRSQAIPPRLLCVLCALSRLNFGVRVKFPPSAPGSRVNLATGESESALVREKRLLCVQKRLWTDKQPFRRGTKAFRQGLRSFLTRAKSFAKANQTFSTITKAFTERTKSFTPPIKSFTERTKSFTTPIKSFTV